MSILNTLVNTQSSLNLGFESYPTVEDFFKLYNKIKKSRPNKSKAQTSKRENPNTAALRLKLNKLANVASGNIFFDVLEDQCELEVIQMHWEYDVNEDTQYTEVKAKLLELLDEVGSLENIPKYILNILNQNEYGAFYSKYSYFEGTTLSIRLNNGTDKGLYICVPFTALKMGYLRTFLESCEIVIPNWPHSSKQNLDNPIPSYNELADLTLDYQEKAHAIFEKRYLP